MKTTEEAIAGHTATRFTDDLGAMCSLVAKMSGLVESRLATAMAAFSESDLGSAAGIARSDEQVNELEKEIDSECLRILALHQPVAFDLRLVTVVLKMITDLERVGDETQKIAKQVAVIDKGGVNESLRRRIRSLGERVADMMHRTLDDFVHLRDNADKIHDMDKVVDEECQSLLAQLLEEMSRNGANVKSLLAAIWSVRSLERIGDHSKNISEYTTYIVQGTPV